MPSGVNALHELLGILPLFKDKDKGKGKDKDKDKGKWCYCIARAFGNFTPLPRLEKYRYDSL